MGKKGKVEKPKAPEPKGVLPAELNLEGALITVDIKKAVNQIIRYLKEREK